MDEDLHSATRTVQVACCGLLLRGTRLVRVGAVAYVDGDYADPEPVHDELDPAEFDLHFDPSEESAGEDGCEVIASFNDVLDLDVAQLDARSWPTPTRSASAPASPAVADYVSGIWAVEQAQRVLTRERLVLVTTSKLIYQQAVGRWHVGAPHLAVLKDRLDALLRPHWRGPTGWPIRVVGLRHPMIELARELSERLQGPRDG